MGKRTQLKTILDRVEKKEKQLQFECLKENFPLI